MWINTKTKIKEQKQALSKKPIYRNKMSKLLFDTLKFFTRAGKTALTYSQARRTDFPREWAKLLHFYPQSLLSVMKFTLLPQLASVWADVSLISWMLMRSAHYPTTKPFLSQATKDLLSWISFPTTKIGNSRTKRILVRRILSLICIIGTGLRVCLIICSKKGLWKNI